MRQAIGIIGALIFSAVVSAQGSVNWSVLPNARTGAPNEDLTFLATIVNGADVTMTCQPRFGGFFTLTGGARGQARFFTYDNGVVGDTANGLVAIPANGRQDYVVVLDVDRAYSGNIIQNIRCTDPDDLIADLRRIPLVNDFQVVVEAGNPPDIVMIGETLSNDGVARVGTTGPRAALMTMAAINIGGTATDFVVFPDITGFSRLQRGYEPTICEIDTAGACTGPEDTFVRISSWPTDEVRLFAVRIRVPPQNGIPFYPDQLRLRVRAAADPSLNASDLSRPADYASEWGPLLDAMFGGYNTAVEAKAQEPFDDIVAPVQQCITQVNGDTGGDFARSGGILLISQPEGTGGRLRGEGYLELSDGQFRTNDIELFLPVSLNAEEGSGDATVTISGGGPDAPVENDVSLSASVAAPDGAQAISLSWGGNTAQGGILDARRDSRVRCAGVPPDGDLDISLEDALTFADEMNAEPGINGETSVNVGEDEDGIYYEPPLGGEGRLLEGFVPHRPGFTGLTEAQVGLMYDGSLSALRIASQVGYSGVFVPAEFDTSGATPVVRCGVMSFTGTTPTVGGDQDNQDGGVVILLPIDEDPAELGDGECIQ
jgi:hypothetical protein